jgi:hypothetical protein
MIELKETTQEDILKQTNGTKQMNLIRIKLDKDEAIRTKSGFIIMNYGEPMEVEALEVEARIDNSAINGCIEVLERFRGTRGIEKISINYDVNE